jgi:hypothetical protein
MPGRNQPVAAVVAGSNQDRDRYSGQVSDERRSAPRYRKTGVFHERIGRNSDLL